MTKKHFNTWKGLNIAMLGVTAITATAQQPPQKPAKPNILFIAVDDLKPILGCYGNPIVKTPNIDRIAKNGTVFLRNYCQQAVSGPTRASLMTGRRPDYTGVWDLKTRMRDVNPDILSMPQYLASQGYTTIGIGKIYDPRCVDKELDKPSWTVPYIKIDESYYAKGYGEPVLNHYQAPETKKLAEKYIKEAKERGLKGKEASDYAMQHIKPSTECADVPDNAYTDGANARKAKETLIKLQKDGKPFFFAVGFAKPHLPFVAPKKYWDMYKRDEMPLAKFQQHSKNGPDIAYHNAGELKAYSDIPALCTFTDQRKQVGLDIDKQKELIHGYYAAISYADANIGLLLNTLDSLGVLNNTIIVLWGDHGWHLGDHDLWCKHTNFENAANAPLIISSPGLKPGKAKSVTEFVDIFPTVCELSGLTIPSTLDGKSLVPMMKNPEASVKEIAVSQYPRDGKLDSIDSKRLGYSNGKVMGYSIRTERYRYVLWMGNGYRSTQHYKKDLIVDTELYDYEKDPLETVNFANEKEYASVAKEMHDKIVNFFNSQVKN